MSEASYGALPEVLARAADVGGLALARALACAFGGRRVFVPRGKRLTPAHPFAAGLRGQGAAMAEVRDLAAVFGGEHLDVPLGPFVGLSAAQARRRAEIRERLRAGQKRAEIARATGTTERTVYRIQAASESAPDLSAGPTGETDA